MSIGDITRYVRVWPANCFCNVGDQSTGKCVTAVRRQIDIVLHVSYADNYLVRTIV